MPEVTLNEGERALRENLRLLSPTEHKAAHNLNTGLLGICAELRRLGRDLEGLHAKIQPILRAMSEDKYDVEDVLRKK